MGRVVSVEAERTFRAVGRPELIDDPRLRTNADRLKNAGALDAILTAFIAQRTQADNVTLLERAEVTVGPIYDILQIIEDPHVVERELIADYPDAEMGMLPMHHVVPRLLRTPGEIRFPAPALGEHNKELLAELGIYGVGYAELLDVGVVHEGGPTATGNVE